MENRQSGKNQEMEKYPYVCVSCPFYICKCVRVLQSFGNPCIATQHKSPHHLHVLVGIDSFCSDILKVLWGLGCLDLGCWDSWCSLVFCVLTCGLLAVTCFINLLSILSWYSHRKMWSHWFDFLFSYFMLYLKKVKSQDADKIRWYN